MSDRRRRGVEGHAHHGGRGCLWFQEPYRHAARVTLSPEGSVRLNQEAGIKPGRLLLALTLALAGCGRSPLAPTVDTRSFRVPLGISSHGPVPDWAPFSIVRQDARDLSWVEGVYAQGRTPIILVSYGDKETIPARVAEAAERFPDAWIEVWNEPNDAQFWEGEPDPEAYVRMVAACRAAAPRAKLLGPGIGGAAMDWDYLERTARAGLGRYLTAISIHPYGVGHPSNLPATAARVRGMFGLPLVVSEWGFDFGPNQAALVAAAVSAAGQAGVEFLVLYSWTDVEGPQQGLTNVDGTPRAALSALMR